MSELLIRNRAKPARMFGMPSRDRSQEAGLGSSGAAELGDTVLSRVIELQPSARPRNRTLEQLIFMRRPNVVFIESQGLAGKIGGDDVDATHDPLIGQCRF